jgi:hypothetical protein
MVAFPVGAMFASIYVFAVASGRGSGRRSKEVI